MRSMTGYGRGESHHQGLKFTVELNSVNRRQLDIVLDLPRELIELEPRIRDEINTIVSRGRLDVVVAMHRSNGAHDSAVRLDEPLARAYLRGMQKLQKDLKLTGIITMDAVLRCPGILKPIEPEIDPGKVWPHVEKALQKALKALVKMREKEGAHLRQDLLRRIETLEKGRQDIQRLSPAMMERYQQQLQQRISKSGIDISLHDERLFKEIVLFADRLDITEELTRLESHLKQFRDNCQNHEPVGRTMDFLTQEINREINTIGSKANHAEISQRVVAMKSELEKIREQIQNVE